MENRGLSHTRGNFTCTTENCCVFIFISLNEYICCCFLCFRFVTHKSIASDVCECGGAKVRNINVKTHPSGINDVIDVFR